MSEINFFAILIFRTFAPFLLFRYPLIGALLCIIADASDVMLIEKFGYAYITPDTYHNFDKVFDVYYLFFEFLLVLRWKDKLAKVVGKYLFFWRALGFAIFELSSLFGSPFRPAFLLSPNIFENFFLAMLIIYKLKPKFLLNPKSSFLILVFVSIPKFIQEYIMHYAYPDQTWYFLRDNIFFFLYK